MKEIEDQLTIHYTTVSNVVKDHKNDFSNLNLFAKFTKPLSMPASTFGLQGSGKCWNNN